MNIRLQDTVAPNQRKSGFFSWLLDLLGFKARSGKSLSRYPDESAEILECLENARNAWINATMNFEYADDEKMIDYYTYEIKAMEVRYEYFLKRAKEIGLKVDMVVTDATNAGSSCKNSI